MRDSQVTERLSDGVAKYPPATVRKLFWLRDNDTVCTLAGFTYGPKLSAAPDLSPTAAKVIRTYEVEAAEQQEPLAFFTQLRVISVMFEIHLTNYGNLFELNRPRFPAPPLSDYELQSIIVSRHQSGAVQLAHLAFRGRRDRGTFVEELVGDPPLPGETPLPREPVLPTCAQGATSPESWPGERIRSVERKLVCETAGMDAIAQDILRNPHSYSGFAAVREYAREWP